MQTEGKLHEVACPYCGAWEERKAVIQQAIEDGVFVCPECGEPSSVCVSVYLETM